MANRLESLRVAMLATDGVEEIELTDPKNALEEAGAIVDIVSPKSDEIKAWRHDHWGGTIEVDLALDKAKGDEYDALVLPGGAMNPDKLRMNPKAVRFVKSFFETGKPVAAICHGPWTLIDAGVVRGLRLTSWPSLRTDLKNAGANWVDQEMVLDRNLVTSRKPDDLPAFNRAMLELFERSLGQAKKDQAQSTSVSPSAQV